MPRKKKIKPSNKKNSIIKGGATPNTCLFHQLEEGLVVDILSRLSVKDIFTCRCVCKSWLFATYDPHFTRLHLSKSPSASGVSILIKPFRGFYRLHFHHIQQRPSPDHRGGGGDSVRDLQVESTVFLRHNGYFKGSSLVNSCNGLVCTIIDNRIYICNPILREQIMLAPSRRNRIISGAALGFIKGTNEYKVLQISQFFLPDSWEWNYEAQIYTIGTGNWRSLGKAPRRYGTFTLPVNYLLHGVAHWLCSPGWRIKYIESFDFESEQFQSIPLPSQDCLKLYSDSANHTGFGVLKGCLFLSLYDYNRKNPDLWIMKNYGVQESWTKLLVLDLSRLCFPTLRCPAEPIMFLRDEEILVITGQNTLICYNTAVKTVTNTVTNTVICYNREAISYTPSFVSVHDISHGEEAIRLEKFVNE